VKADTVVALAISPWACPPMPSATIRRRPVVAPAS
jgi:hypothetical protein